MSCALFFAFGKLYFVLAVVVTAGTDFSSCFGVSFLLCGVSIFSVFLGSSFLGVSLGASAFFSVFFSGLTSDFFSDFFDFSDFCP